MSLLGKLKDLKEEVKGKQLTRTDRLLLDILSEMVDILTSSDLKEKLNQKLKRKTSTTREISNGKKVLSLSDFLRSRNDGRGEDRRE